MLKNKAIVVFFAISIALIASRASAFTDVKSGSVSISEGGGEGSSTSLNNLVAWLDNPNVYTSGGYIGWRGEYQQKLLWNLLENLDGSVKYPQLVAFLSNKISAGSWDWYYYGGGNFIAATPSACPKQEVTGAFYTNFGASFPITVCKYGLLTALEEQSSATEVSELRQWLNENQPELGKCLDSKYATQDSFQIYASSCSLVCKQENKYNYTFKYSTDKNGDWSLCSDNDFDLENKTYKAQKCENIKMTFSPQAEWFPTLGSQCTDGKTYQVMFISPPTPFINCSDKDSCLSQAREYDMSDGSLAKGVQQVPANFISTTENSLTSSDKNFLPCNGNICTPNTSGDYSLSATTPESTYYGQCKGDGLTILPDGATVPAVTSSINIDVKNQAPTPTVSFSKNSIAPDEEVTATCDITDPDTCSDKIARVKWSCEDKDGKYSNCSFWKTGISQWENGGITNDIASSEQSNPYQATVKFKVSEAGDYTVTCEATDNDANNPLTGTGEASISTQSSCGADGVCNQSCPYDPDCCQNKTYYDSHTQCPETCLTPDGICNLNCPYDPDCCKDKIYFDSHPQCGGVIAAGSCIITRTKPGLDIKTAKPLEEIRYQAAVLGGDDPIGYVWYCDKNGAVSANHSSKERTDEQSCNYANEGHYEPKASYQYKNAKGVTETQDCINAQGIGIEINKGEKDITSCSIFSDSLDVRKGSIVKAKISASPDGVDLSNLVVTWKANGQTTVLKGNESFNITMINVGATTIEATAKKQDGTTNIYCGSILIHVTDTMKWGL